MPSYRVMIPYCLWMTVEVKDAEDADDAIEKALETDSPSGYVGNGGTDKLVGVSAREASVDVCDEPLCSEGIDIEVEEI